MSKKRWTQNRYWPSLSTKILHYQKCGGGDELSTPSLKPLYCNGSVRINTCIFLFYNQRTALKHVRVPSSLHPPQIISHLKTKPPKSFKKNKSALCLSLHFLQEHQRVWRAIHTDLRWPPSSAPQPGTRNKDYITLIPGNKTPCKAECKKMETKPEFRGVQLKVRSQLHNLKSSGSQLCLTKQGFGGKERSSKQLVFCSGQAHH